MPGFVAAIGTTLLSGVGVSAAFIAAHSAFVLAVGASNELVVHRRCRTQRRPPPYTMSARRGVTPRLEF